MITRGAEWRRWEPHIHAPGTVLNNQFGGADAWEQYLTKLEGLSPKIEAIAVTDYYVTDTYRTVIEHKKNGRLPDVKLIFPNIEVRLDAAAKSGFVNLHFLVSPEDPNHLEEIERLFTQLQFRAHGQNFNCTRAELVRLGKLADTSITDDNAALAHGATQVKVGFTQLRQVIDASDWAKRNILIAVAGGAGDGTSGLRQAADATTRQEIENFADIIFASSVAQREFWLGLRGPTVAEIRERYRTCKPCLHGSDAHDQDTVGSPVEDRFSWVKGSLTFDALRQACIDPAGRAFVGSEPPRHAMPSQVIAEVEIEDAPWAATPVIPLNPGLVAIIGARGSGKTALADIIAAGCDAIPAAAWKADEDISPSFLVRARPLIGEDKAKLTWGGGAVTQRRLDGGDVNDPKAYSRARYLSQQFVEELCSAKGASEGLIREIERVIYEAHRTDDQDGAGSFVELRRQHTERFQQARAREASAIAAISERIAEELEKEALVEPLGNAIAQREAIVAGYNADLAKLVVRGSEAQAARHTALNDAAQKQNARIQAFSGQRRTFVSMQDEVRSMRAATAPEMLRQAKARHLDSGLSVEQWDAFLLVYKGNVDQSLTDYVAWADGEIAKIRGTPPPEGDVNTPLLPADADLAATPLAMIRAEMARLEKLIGADAVVRNQYAALAGRIGQENQALQALRVRLEDAKGASDRRRTLQTERDQSYGRLFAAVASEETALEALYAPLMQRIAASSGTLLKLSFSVIRTVDAAAWANRAEEELIDCRKSGPFFGRGSLVKVANEMLKGSWQSGSPQDVQAAMSLFISTYTKDLFQHAPYAPTQQEDFRAWSRSFAHWLFGTDHIRVRYELSYDGIDIRKLSPGTRGIVLLLLYLALDDADDRPLIIDQPEENLDPKSVFDELVTLFIAARAKRQVIIVTHNANLVINTDADQVIIADAGRHTSGDLPVITYTAGGLEDETIRKSVCDILEGGEDAFRERARRLRVRLER